MNRQQECGTSRVHAVTTGLMFVATGVVMLGVLRGWWVIDRYWAYWPLVFVFPAIGRLTAPVPERSVVAGLGWLALAAGLVGANLGILQLRIRDLVPLVLVAIGARLLYRARTEQERAR